MTNKAKKSMSDNEENSYGLNLGREKTRKKHLKKYIYVYTYNEISIFFFFFSSNSAAFSFQFIFSKLELEHHDLVTRKWTTR